MIVPTVGRVMWYRPGVSDASDQTMINNSAGMAADIAQPMDAHVVYVWGDNLVNLVVFDHQGNRHKRSSVPIVQEGSPYKAGDSPYCEWMPYQVGQAKKHEAAAAV